MGSRVFRNYYEGHMDNNKGGVETREGGGLGWGGGSGWGGCRQLQLNNKKSKNKNK